MSYDFQYKMDAVLLSKMQIRKVALRLSERDETPAQTHTNTCTVSQKAEVG